MKFSRLLLAPLFVAISLSNLQAQFDPNYKGYYLLKTQFRGDGESLEGNGSASPTMNGSAFMSPQKGATGQRWKVVAEPGKQGYYRLKTMDRGENECLEGNQKSSNVKDGVAFMMPCKNVTGQLWKLEPSGNFYRLSTLFQGKDHCLEGNQMKGIKNGNAFLNTCQNVSGQLWKFERIQ
ncbi:hypothetical protein GCM10028807_40310 [Spirosoma daeguense]